MEDFIVETAPMMGYLNDDQVFSKVKPLTTRIVYKKGLKPLTTRIVYKKGLKPLTTRIVYNKGLKPSTTTI
jgi:hypothetical protein